MRGRRRGAAAAVTLVVVLASAGIVLAATTGPEYLDVDSFQAKAQNARTAKLSATTGGAIPRRANEFIRSHLVVGLAWADLDTGKVFVATIHPVLGRDSRQNPDGWHAHTATVSGGATPPNDFCVASIDSSPTAGIRILGNTMRVNVQTRKLPVSPVDFDVAAGFTVEEDAACTSGLAVRLVENG